MTGDATPGARDQQRDTFLHGCGWGQAAQHPLPGDASFRRYIRLRGPDGTAMLMDAPPPREDVRPFVTVARLLAEAGYAAPRLLAEDPEHGFLLLEDLGDRTVTRALAEGADEAAIYGLATDLLIDLHGRGPVGADRLPSYDTDRLLAEARLLVDWAWPAAKGAPAPDAVVADFEAAWRQALDILPVEPRVLVLRDYHVDNLMVLEGRDGLAACGLLDFQDAVIGAPAYDLVSLLEDARRDVPPALADAMIARYLAARPEMDAEAFATAYAVLGAQRATKIIGIFTRLWTRDGKPGYLRHIPRVWGWLAGGLYHPALAAPRAWFHRHMPDQPDYGSMT